VKTANFVVAPQVLVYGPQRLQRVVDPRQWFPPALEISCEEILIGEGKRGDKRRGAKEIYDRSCERCRRRKNDNAGV